MSRPKQDHIAMIQIGKRLAFIAMMLALLCIVPATIFQYLEPEKATPIALGALLMFGTPAFAVLSLAGLLIWAIGEVRRADRENS